MGDEIRGLHLLLFLTVLTEWDADDFAAAVERAKLIGPGRAMPLGEIEKSLRKLSTFILKR